MIRLDGTVAEGDLAELRMSLWLLVWPWTCPPTGTVAELTAERAGTQAVWLVAHGVLAFGSGH